MVDIHQVGHPSKPAVHASYPPRSSFGVHVQSMTAIVPRGQLSQTGVGAFVAMCDVGDMDVGGKYRRLNGSDRVLCHLLRSSSTLPKKLRL